MRRVALGLWVLSFFVLGCPDRQEALGTADGGAEAPAIVAGPDASMGPLKVSARYEQADGGWVEIPLATGERPLIEPTQRLELATNLSLNNYRVRLFDEVDRAMESDDEAEDGAGSLTYRILLGAPLKTGHRYTLSLDAQTGSAITDIGGRIHPDQRFEFQVAGEKEKPAPPPKKPARKKRR